MEGVSEIVAQSEPQEEGVWSRMKSWVQKKFEGKTSEIYNLSQPKALILWEDSAARSDWNNQSSYKSAFSTFGFQVSTLNWKNFKKASISPGTIVTVPHAIAEKLSTKQNDWLVEFVREGGFLVLDGPCDLGKRLGIRTENRSLRVHQVRDMLYGSQPHTWNPAANVVRFSTRNHNI